MLGVDQVDMKKCTISINFKKKKKKIVDRQLYNICILSILQYIRHLNSLKIAIPFIFFFFSSVQPNLDLWSEKEALLGIAKFFFPDFLFLMNPAYALLYNNEFGRV